MQDSGWVLVLRVHILLGKQLVRNITTIGVSTKRSPREKKKKLG